MEQVKPDWAIKLRKFCYNNNLTAKDLAEILNVKVPTVYKYWSGDISIPDDSKKKLEEELGLDIYDTFFKEL